MKTFRVVRLGYSFGGLIEKEEIVVALRYVVAEGILLFYHSSVNPADDKTVYAPGWIRVEEIKA